MNVLSKLICIAAIPRPENLQQAVTIFLDWLKSNGINLYYNEMYELDNGNYDEDRSFDDYPKYLMERITGRVRINSFHDDDYYDSQARQDNVQNIAHELSELISGNNALRHWIADSLENIITKGFLPDVTGLARILTSETDMSFFRSFIEHQMSWMPSRKAAADSNFELYNLNLADPVITNAIFGFKQTYGRDFMINTAKTRPQDLWCVLRHYMADDNEAFSRLVNHKANFDLLVSYASELDEINPQYPGNRDDDPEANETYMMDLAALYGFDEDENIYSLKSARKKALQRFNTALNDYLNMTDTQTVAGKQFTELYQEIVSRGNRLPNTDPDLIQKFLFYYNKLYTMKLSKFENYFTLKQYHDTAARYHREIQHAKRRINKEPFVEFPPMLVKDMPPVITYIDNEEDLIYEGKDLNHCVGSYSNKCQAGDSFIYRYDGYSRGTIELDDQGQLQQFLGENDDEMDEDDQKIVAKWLEGTLDLRQHGLDEKIDTSMYYGTDSLGRKYETDDLFNQQEGYEYPKPEPKEWEIKKPQNLLALNASQWFGLVDKFSSVK